MAIKYLSDGEELKEFNKEAYSDALLAFSEEGKTLSALHHTNIVRFFGTSMDPSSRLLLVMEYCERGSLFDVLGLERPFGWAELCQFALDCSRVRWGGEEVERRRLRGEGGKRRRREKEGGRRDAKWKGGMELGAGSRNWGCGGAGLSPISCINPIRLPPKSALCIPGHGLSAQPQSHPPRPQVAQPLRDRRMGGEGAFGPGKAAV